MLSTERNTGVTRICAMDGARILIVEDEVLIANNLLSVLEDAGHYPIGVAPDLQTALQLGAKRPDIALVDVHLRDGATGPEIAEQLSRLYNVAVLFVTANPRMVLDQAAGLGVLDKPCDEDLITAAIDYALVARHAAALPSPPPGLKLLRGDPGA